MACVGSCTTHFISYCALAEALNMVYKYVYSDPMPARFETDTSEIHMVYAALLSNTGIALEFLQVNFQLV